MIRKILSITARPWTMAGIALFALLIGGPVWFFIYDRAGREEWERYAATEQARGVKLSLKENTPPPVPDHENFGALPIFRIDERARQSRLPAIPQSKVKAQTFLAEPELGLSFTPESWRDRFARAGWIDTPSTDAGADMRLALLRYDDVLAEVADGLGRPHCSFGITWKPNPYQTYMSYVRIVQQVAFIATLRANAHLVSGNSESALQEIRFLNALRKRLAGQPSSSAAWTRNVIGRQQVITIYEGLSRHAWSAAQLVEMIKLLEDFDPIRDMAFWAESERAMSNDFSEWILRGEVTITDPGWKEIANPEKLFLNFKFVRAFPGVVRRNQLAANRSFPEFVRKLDLVNGIDRNGSRGQERPDSACYAIARFVVAEFNTDRLGFLSLATNYSLAKTACALELYRLRHAQYPQAIDELVPDYLPSVPHEPLSNDSLIYHPTDDGRYRLHSRGFNQRDDNGVVSRWRQNREDFNYLQDYVGYLDVPWIAQPSP